jgi:hypothetical protein
VRKLRRILNLLVPAMGMALVIGAVLFGESLPIQLFLVAAGLLMTESGMWRLMDPVLPDERQYLALRTETDHFIGLVRQLNAAALAAQDQPGPERGFDEVQAEMHRSVDRMVAFAGQESDDEGREPAPSPSAVGSGR